MKALFDKFIVGPVMAMLAVLAMAYVLFCCKGKDPEEYDSYY